MLYRGFDEPVPDSHPKHVNLTPPPQTNLAPVREAAYISQTQDPLLNSNDNCNLNHLIKVSSLLNSSISPSTQTIDGSGELPDSENDPHPLNKIKILFWNIQGIGSKIEIDNIQHMLTRYDIIFLLETMKLDSFDPLLPNFTFFHCQRKYQHPRARRPSGGIGILVKDSIKSLVTIEKLNEHVIWLSIKQKQKPSLIIGGTYIPPAGSKIYLNYNIDDIFQALQTDISNFLNLSPFVALCGDFNSRTGGLSDLVTDINGRDAELITCLNDVITLPKSELHVDWTTKERQMKDKGKNNFGKELIQLCKSSNMRIMNGFLNADNTENFTCHAPLGKSTVDYLVSSPKFSESIVDFNVSPKLVESDHVPLNFSITYNDISDGTTKNKLKPHDYEKRFQYIFDKSKILQYKESLTSEPAQEKLTDLSYAMSKDTHTDNLIKSTYDYIEHCIHTTFKKKQFKSVTNTFPKNSWYDLECKAARKLANEYAKTHDLNIEEHNLRYKSLHKKYRYTVQRKKRQHQQRNRDELNRLNSTNQTECWKLWNKLTNTQTKTPNLPDIDTFHEYFTGQIKPPNCQHFDQEHMRDITKRIRQINQITLLSDGIGASICDNRITETEVALNIKKLKNNKAAGIDGISGEFFKYVADELTVPFCAIFNCVFDSGEYPTMWAEGLINALHKKGDFSNPDNYRKITITVAMAKVFDSILNARLYFKNDALSLDDPFQFGFTPSRGTTDCVFVLDTIIRHQQSKRKPVYLCFVDFTKAFDYINRNALYYKLHRQHMGIKMLKIIMSMFDKAQAKVHQLGNLSAPIDSTFGVLQGGILSPKLFNEFLSDLPEYLNTQNGIEIDGTIFTHLLYADDIVLVSESANGLQNNIDSLHNFCAKWHLIVNTSKTKVMQIGAKDQTKLNYDKHEIENVNTFKYLGHTITDHRNIHKRMPDYIATQAQKALFALQGRMKPSLGHIPPTLAIKMFDSYVLPILEFNSTFWSGTSENSKIEKVQIGYLKRVLGVRRQTPTAAIYAETGRFPLKLRQKLNTVNYWARIRNLPNYDILNKCLQIQVRLHNTGQINWYTKVVTIMTEANEPNWSTADPDVVVKKVKLELYKNEQTSILNEINDSNKLPKLRSYKLFKTSYCLEPYLNLNLPKKTYSNIARFRTSSHNLKIETGRHNRPKTPVEDRKCEKCDTNEIEDEFHCLLICAKHADPRAQLMNTVNNQILDFDKLDKKQQFTTLMSNKHPEIIQAIGSFLNVVMK